MANGALEVIKYLDHPLFEEDLKKLGGTSLNIETFKTNVITELKKNPKLAECTPSSIKDCIYQTARLNLFPGGGFGLVSYVAFKDTCTFILGYKGMVELAYRSGIIMSAHLVFKNDTNGMGIVYEEGTEGKFSHIPAPLDQPQGPLIGLYSKAHFIKEGITVYAPYRLEQLNKSRDASKSYQWAHDPKNKPKGGGREDSMWHKYLFEMYKKTAIRRHFGELPKFGNDTTPILLPDDDDGITIDESGVVQGAVIENEVPASDPYVDEVNAHIQDILEGARL
jgi:recombination protein RecT